MDLKGLANRLKVKSKLENPEVEFIIITKTGQIVTMDIEANADDLSKLLKTFKKAGK